MWGSKAVGVILPLCVLNNPIRMEQRIRHLAALPNTKVCVVHRGKGGFLGGKEWRRAGGAKQRVLAMLQQWTTYAYLPCSAKQYGGPGAAADLSGTPEPRQCLISDPVVQVSMGPRDDLTCSCCHYTCTHHYSTRGEHSPCLPSLPSSAHGGIQQSLS